MAEELEKNISGLNGKWTTKLEAVHTQIRCGKEESPERY